MVVNKVALKIKLGHNLVRGRNVVREVEVGNSEVDTEPVEEIDLEKVKIDNKVLAKIVYKNRADKGYKKAIEGKLIDESKLKLIRSISGDVPVVLDRRVFKNILPKIREKLLEKNIEVNDDLLFDILNFEFYFVRECIKNKKSVRLRRFGSFYIKNGREKFD